MNGMSATFWCRYCGKLKSWDERDYETGLLLAEEASLEALGHTNDVTPYLICRQCAEEVSRARNDYGI